MEDYRLPGDRVNPKNDCQSHEEHRFNECRRAASGQWAVLAWGLHRFAGAIRSHIRGIHDV